MKFIGKSEAVHTVQTPGYSSELHPLKEIIQSEIESLQRRRKRSAGRITSFGVLRLWDIVSSWAGRNYELRTMNWELYARHLASLIIQFPLTKELPALK